MRSVLVSFGQQKVATEALTIGLSVCATELLMSLNDNDREHKTKLHLR